LDLDELIKELLDVRFEHGNLPVVCYDNSGEAVGRISSWLVMKNRDQKPVSLYVQVKPDSCEEDDES